ncbi:hypothetical protein Y032_0074g844 [Ancylostoma ceylanicum]|uniref:Uncharacterized protein n=1 Tax=Ancylostoma ceylanicum TaxID=53326 RepID=A0A016TVP0_9BILA|nr:hypothetical protein Y032_0074g844 [Ancylostoma ceylanicum]
MAKWSDRWISFYSELQTVANKGRDAARALWLSAAPHEAAGNHDVSAFLRVPAQQARCLGAADNQSVRAA